MVWRHHLAATAFCISTRRGAQIDRFSLPRVTCTRRDTTTVREDEGRSLPSPKAANPKRRNRIRRANEPTPRNQLTQRTRPTHAPRLSPRQRTKTQQLKRQSPAPSAHSPPLYSLASVQGSAVLSPRSTRFRDLTFRGNWPGAMLRVPVQKHGILSQDGRFFFSTFIG